MYMQNLSYKNLIACVQMFPPNNQILSWQLTHILKIQEVPENPINIFTW